MWNLNVINEYSLVITKKLKHFGLNILHKCSFHTDVGSLIMLRF